MRYENFSNVSRKERVAGILFTMLLLAGVWADKALAMRGRGDLGCGSSWFCEISQFLHRWTPGM